jgi:hypothetical protein
MNHRAVRKPTACSEGFGLVRVRGVPKSRASEVPKDF